MHFADSLILASYLILLSVILWFCRKTTFHPADFFLAGRSFGAFPIGLSVMVTTFSAVNYLALPGEVYEFGLYVLASLPVFFLAAWPVTRFWMPFFLKLRPVSIYAFLEDRYDLRVRLLASGLFLFWRLLWMSVALYASCRIMAILTGMNFFLILLVCGITVTIYSSIGGMRAVVWTDVLQFCVLLGSILLGVFFAGQGADFKSILTESGCLKPFHPIDWNYLSVNPCERITLWSALLGTFVAFLTRFGADQMVMQRYLSAVSLSAARKGLWLNGAVSTLALGLLVIFGLSVRVYVRRAGLPDDMPPIKAIALLLKSFPAGVTGLVAAGLLAATMSSIDSGLNSCSAAVTMDFLPHWRKKIPSPRLLTVILVLPVMVSSACILPALNRKNTLFMVMNKIVNTMGTPLLAIMICALFLPRIKKNAVFYGATAGTFLTLILSGIIRNLSLHYYALLSLIVTFTAIGIVQLFLRGDSKSKSI